MIPEALLGLIKVKGSAYCLAPERFNQMKVKRLIPYDLLKKQLLGYCVTLGLYWVILMEDGEYVRVPFARNEEWFKAMTSEVELSSIADLPHIYITGQA